MSIDSKGQEKVSSGDQSRVALTFVNCIHGEEIFKLHNEPQIMEISLEMKDEGSEYLKKKKSSRCILG